MAIEKVFLNISGMTCSHCVATVERALSKVDGLLSKSISLETSTGTLEFDSEKTDATQLTAAVNNTGIYKAVLLNN